MKNKLSKIFVLTYITILIVPLLLVALQIKVNPVSDKESKIGLNFKRNFPLKTDLFKVYMEIKTKGFKTNPIPNMVLDTGNDWKFLGNNFGNVLSESKGILVFNDREIETLTKNLREKKEWFEKENIKFYLTIAPSKHSIYGNKIPIKKRHRKTKAQQVDSICKSLDINIVDLGSKFKDEKEYDLYLKTDSHWNHLGGYYAFQATIEAIAKDFKQTSFNFYKKDAMQIEEIDSDISDLNDILYIAPTERSIAILPKDTTRKLNRLPKTLEAPSNYHFNDNAYEERYTSDRNSLNILVFRDSFFGAYYNLMADNFGNSTFIFWHNFNPQLIKNEKPDIVCYEIVERNIDVLLHKNFNHAPN